MSALSVSQEDYLEAIYEIAGDSGIVRVRDVAKHQNVSMASVSGAMKRLEKQDLINHGRYDYIELTDKGRECAEKVAKRHALLKKFLIEVLKVDEKVADKDACAIEHHLSDATVNKLISFLEGIDE